MAAAKPRWHCRRTTGNNPDDRRSAKVTPARRTTQVGQLLCIKCRRAVRPADSLQRSSRYRSATACETKARGGLSLPCCPIAHPLSPLSEGILRFDSGPIGRYIVPPAGGKGNLSYFSNFLAGWRLCTVLDRSVTWNLGERALYYNEMFLGLSDSYEE